jgi:hypothetical protein
VQGSPVRRLPVCGLEGVVNVRLYEAQKPAWRCPVAARSHSVGDGDAVTGMVLGTTGMVAQG